MCATLSGLSIHVLMISMLIVLMSVLASIPATGTQEVAPIVTSKLDYVPGLVAKAIVENVKLNAAHSWVAPWYYSMKSFGDTYYNKVSSDGKAGKSQDDLNGVKMFFALKDLTASGTYANSTTNERCNTVMGTALSGLETLNTNYIIGAFKSGVFRLKELRLWACMVDGSTNLIIRTRCGVTDSIWDLLCWLS